MMFKCIDARLNDFGASIKRSIIRIVVYNELLML